MPTWLLIAMVVGVLSACTQHARSGPLATLADSLLPYERVNRCGPALLIGDNEPPAGEGPAQGCDDSTDASSPYIVTGSGGRVHEVFQVWNFAPEAQDSVLAGRTALLTQAFGAPSQCDAAVPARPSAYWSADGWWIALSRTQGRIIEVHALSPPCA